MEEMGKEHACLGNQLKRWTDEYAPFVAEAKGGAVNPDYDNFLVTSNYSLEDIFGDDPKVLDPLRRRFEVHHFADPFKVLNPPQHWTETAIQAQADLQGPCEAGIIGQSIPQS